MPAPEPADVGLVVALPIEIAPFRSVLTDVRTHHVGGRKIIDGRLGEKLIALVISGPGRQSARRATGRLILGHRPRWIISAGFAGALTAELERYAIVTPTRISDLDGHSFAFDGGVRDRTLHPHMHLCTTDRIVRTPLEKRQLRERTHADLVDMESSAIVQVCAEKQVLFSSVRIITDPLDEELPPEISAFTGPTGAYRFGAVAGALWRRPGCVSDLWQLRGYAMEAANRLAGMLPQVIQSLG